MVYVQLETNIFLIFRNPVFHKKVAVNAVKFCFICGEKWKEVVP